MYYILAVNKHGDMIKRARIVFENKMHAELIQINLLIKGHAARLTESEEMPDRTIEECALALKFVNIGIEPLSPSVTGRPVSPLPPFSQ